VPRFADRVNKNEGGAGFRVSGIDVQIMAFDIVPSLVPRIALTSMPRDAKTETALVDTIQLLKSAGVEVLENKVQPKVRA
jgi:hypothetical protein